MTAPASRPIWDRLVGQDLVVAELGHAVADAEKILRGEHGPGMTHAWLVTGPPGSGRSTAATCFAAALVCPENGCGVCEACRTAPIGAHPDVDVVATDAVNYKISEARDLILRASMAPIKGPWHVIVIEDADRFRDDATAVLLKAFEEPPPHTVWILCAPSVEDVLPTIVSRARHVPLRTPSAVDVAELLVANYGADVAMASFAARASQGHIGRARALARDEHVRMRRQEVLRIPFGLNDVATCFTAAANLLGAATEDAHAITDPMDEVEKASVLAQFGDPSDAATKSRIKRLSTSAMSDLEKRQKARRTRTVRDQVDRALLDLMGLYRDVLVVQFDGSVPLINEEMRPQIAQLAARSVQNDTGRRLQAIAYGRQQIEANVTPLLALESLMIELKDPWIRVAAG
jgi:DNA polymerase III subunit delta'